MSKPRDEERIGRISTVLAAKSLDALVCALPSNVLMLSGYWPVIGTAVAIVTREGQVAVVAPEDEREAASDSWADVVRTFKSGSLDNLKTVQESISEPLRDLKRTLGFHPGTKVGFEGGSCFDPSGYASAFIYGAGIQELLGTALPFVVAVDATECLGRLRSALTRRELQLLRRACEPAREAFHTTKCAIAAGMREFEIAAMLRSKLTTGDGGNERCSGFAYCMSGPNSARAYAAYQQSQSRLIAPGDFVLLHCNSSCGGFWTDITRTYSVAPLEPRKEAIIDAVLEARGRAINAVRPGIRASAVDSAARETLESRGFGKAFKHATGHGVGFAAINHNALPRIHPLSDELLEVGMVFNIEPAVYIPELGGMRHCDMVAVSPEGVEVLTPFQTGAGDLLISEGQRAGSGERTGSDRL